MFRILSLIVILSSLGLSSLFAMQQSQLGKRSKQSCPKVTGELPFKKQKNELLRNQAVQQFENIARGRASFTEELRSFVSENPNVKDEHGNTLLHNALIFHNQELIAELIENPLLNINVRNDVDRTFLQLAVRANNPQAVELILKRKPEKLDALYIFSLDAFDILKIAYAMNEHVIVNALEEFFKNLDTEFTVLKKKTTLFKLAHNQQMSHGQKELRERVQLLELFQHFEKFFKFCNAKESLLLDPAKLFVLFDFNDVNEIDSHWRENFTKDEVFFLCSALSEGGIDWLINLIQNNIFTEPRELIDCLQFFITNDLHFKNLLLSLENPEGLLAHYSKFSPSLKKIALFYLVIVISNIEDYKMLLDDESAWLINVIENGKTLLHFAIKNEDIALVNAILAHNPNLSIRDAQGEHPLDLAIEGENADIFSAFLPYINIGHQNNDGSTLLHRIVTTGKIEFINALLDHGFDINAQNNDGDTPLHLACRSIYQSHDILVAVIGTLLARNPDLNLKNNNGETSFHIVMGLRVLPLA